MRRGIEPREISGGAMKKFKVLIVEDDEVTAALEKQILENEGFEVDTAGDGLEGLEKIGLNRYDVIISDFDMPRMKGDELQIEVQKLSQDLAKRMIFVSGNAYCFTRLRESPLLLKPFSFEQLVEAINNLISSDVEPG